MSFSELFFFLVHHGQELIEHSLGDGGKRRIIFRQFLYDNKNLPKLR